MEHFHGSSSTHYVMWNNLKSKFPYSTSMINSAAFHEEAEGGLMAVTWPPRSYSCSFCQRDFRSAQALGGHMNVHRRDRAKLNQQNHNIAAAPKPQPTFISINGDNCVETRLSVGINYSYGSTTVICKRPHNKMFANPMEDDDDHQDIDLELRLGDRILPH